MAATNFSLLTDEQKTVWSRKTWIQARNLAFTTRFTGTSQNAMIHRVTELTKTEKGTRAVVTLVADLEEDGTAGDSTLEGKEEAIKAYDQVVNIDQLRHANKSEGRMAEQGTVVLFRGQSRDKLAYWLSDRMDQMAFLALSGVTFDTKTNGAPRTGSQLAALEYAADVTPPTAGRHFRWNSANGTFDAADTGTVEEVDLPSYNMLVQLKAMIFDKYIRPIRGEGGYELFHVFLPPQGLAQLKLDSDFRTNWQQALPRSKENPLFKGTAMFDSCYVDGMAIHAHRHVFNTQGLAGGSKWGPDGQTQGGRMLVCGAQALAMADIGPGFWVEKDFDYDNQPGISYGKIFGYKKPVFRSQYELTPSDEDFGVVCVDLSIDPASHA